MSLLENNLKSGSSSSLVEKILEQGQRLRNSMVQAVLNNDPFNKEILNSYNNSPQTNVESRKVDSAIFTTCDTHIDTKSHHHNDLVRIHKYLRGEDMCMNEEMKALETLRSMSPNSLIQSTSGVKLTCHCKDSCDICKEYEHTIRSRSVSPVSINRMYSEKHPSTHKLPTYYEKHASTHKLSSKFDDHDHYTVTTGPSKIRSQENVSERNPHKGFPIKNSSKKLKAVRETFQENQNLLKYVDSLKINIYSLKLSSAGKTKVTANDNISKPYLPSANTYFVEYTLPDILVKNIPKSRAKVNTGLNPDKTVRFCSKKLQGESVYFKQQSIHNISNANMIDLSNIKIEFRVSYRSIKQRTPLLIGKATVTLGFLLTNQFFTGEQELVLVNEGAPVVLGNLKVCMQFGCDKLYFGKEFVDAISCSKENKNLSESDSIHKLSDNELTFQAKKEKVLTKTNQNVIQTETNTDPSQPSNKKESTSATNQVAAKTDDETPLLYALIHISEVRLLTKSLNSYIICRGFSRDDTITSKTVYNDFKPKFNLYQIIPILFNEDFVRRLKDNYIIVEVWEKKEDAVDKLLGLSKLPLQQLYVAYRNPVIVKHLVKNQNPVISVDWWEPITCPVSSTETGQLRALIALGSSTQIETLEQSRGLKCVSEKNSPKRVTTDIVDDGHRLQSSISLNSDNNFQSKLPPVVHFKLPEERGRVEGNGIVSSDNNYFSKRPERISRTTSFDDAHYFSRRMVKDSTVDRSTSYEKNRNPSLHQIEDSNNFSRHPERIDRSTSVEKAGDITFDKIDDQNYYSNPSETIDRAANSNKTFRRLTSYENITNRDNCSNSSLSSQSRKKTILVSDKYVQQPEIEISPSIISIDKIVKTTNRSSKVDASTQSEIADMDSDKDKTATSTATNQFTQRDFLNSFLEQLLSARDISHKDTHVENSTNAETTTHAAFPVVDNKTSPTVSSSGDQNDPNMNNSHTFHHNSINTTSVNSNSSVRNTSDLLESLQKALTGNKNENNKNNLNNSTNENEISDSFKAHIVIENALHLPSRKKCKSKKNKTKSPKNNEEILPSTYVTFKGCSEGDYMVTSVVPKSTSPRWDYRCDLYLPSDLLLNNQKRLIFKVWRKANGPSLQPNFQTDIVLGFAALDLTVLLSGLPNVQGWFNIVDFSSKCNGQIKIHLTPLENLSKFNEYKRAYVPEKLRIETSPVNLTSIPQKPSEPEQDATEDSIPSELLSRALKRKFTELDEITQRLRQRLTAVTNDDSDLSNDDFIDEFERDLNTICVETEPFNFSEENITINVDELKNSGEIASSSKVNSTSDLLTSINAYIDPLINLSSRNSESGSSATVSEINVPTVQENLNKLDTHLTEGKIKIDSLLEKLSLLTGDNDNQNKSDRSFSSRYVSGCSINQEPESSNQVFKDSGIERSGDVDPDLIFNPLLFQQMFTASLDSTPRLDSLDCLSSVHCTTLKNLVQDSTSSGSSRDLQSISSNSLLETNITRQAPDGAGNMSND